MTLTTRSKLVVASVVAALLTAALLLVTASGGERQRPIAQPAHDPVAPAHDPAHTAPVDVRTLVVKRGGAEPPPSRPGRAMHALRLRGRVPARSTMATVTSDEDCAADAHGISHCLNRLRLGEGRRLIVRHPHAMSQVPCMTPGERVRVRAG